MKKTLFVCCALALALGAQAQWKPVGDKIKTPHNCSLSIFPNFVR